ncbi:MAG: STM4011 family radical SAM protein [Flavobacteriales bacterium]|nr:STM4011 family radical SAM protein [Flavobacteriales bacterium]
MKKSINILYRGSLDSCNYDCDYCPFAKKKNTRQELAYDRDCLNKFVDWVQVQKYQLKILFTPWGEALIRGYYQDAMNILSNSNAVEKVTIQTNLSCSLDWIDEANTDKLALWTTFHPTECTIERYVSKCLGLIKKKVDFSVGIVGLKENFEAIRELRRLLPKDIYVWVNAYKREPNYYRDEDIDFLNEIDPLFDVNNTIYETYGKSCAAGEHSISIDEKGDIKRCHFISEIRGNIFETSLDTILRPSPCSNNVCRCYIGYINLKELNLENVYGSRILERIPTNY